MTSLIIDAGVTALVHDRLKVLDVADMRRALEAIYQHPAALGVVAVKGRHLDARTLQGARHRSFPLQKPAVLLLGAGGRRPPPAKNDPMDRAVRLLDV